MASKLLVSFSKRVAIRRCFLIGVIKIRFGEVITKEYGANSIDVVFELSESV